MQKANKRRVARYDEPQYANEMGTERTPAPTVVANRDTTAQRKERWGDGGCADVKSGSSSVAVDGMFCEVASARNDATYLAVLKKPTQKNRVDFYVLAARGVQL